jgi:hypothetical protein
MNAYLKVAGHNPTKIKINYLNLEEINVADASYMPGHDHWDGTLNGVKLIKDNPVFKEEKVAENIEIKSDLEMDSTSEKGSDPSDSEENNDFFDLSKISF